MTTLPGSSSPSALEAASTPIRLIVAAGPRSTERLLFGAAVAEAAAGTSVSVLFSEEGLDFLAGDWPSKLEQVGVQMTLCSRSARDRRMDPSTIPSIVGWSSLTNFLADAGPDARLWTVFA